MKKYIAILLLACSGSAFAEAYVGGSKPFIAIKDANREADAWAICAASFDVTAEVLAGLSQPAQSKQLQELASAHPEINKDLI